MLFNVGDRVIAKPGNYRAVGKDNIGTITAINIEDQFYVINWDLKGPETYQSVENYNKNQWNMGYESVEKYFGSLNNPAHYRVILKIKQMESRRKANGYSF